ncbi:MAG: hypothetical protein ACQERS_02750 [Bacteroidota bacterium]
MKDILNMVAICGIVFIIAFGCEKEDNDPECYGSVCLEGELIMVNYCWFPDDVYSVLIQILNPDINIGDTLTSDPTYDNVIECYNLPPKYIDHLDDTLYFTYRDISGEDTVSRACDAFSPRIHVNKGIFILCISTKGCEYLKRID